MKKKLFALLCAALLVCSLAACGQNAAEPGETTYVVGICQLPPTWRLTPPPRALKTP